MKIFSKNVCFILLVATLVCNYFHTHNIFASQKPQGSPKAKPKKSKHKGINKKKIIPAWKDINNVTTDVLGKIASCLDLSDQICFARTNNYIHETLGKLGNDSILVLNRIDDYETFTSIANNKNHDVWKKTKTIIFFPVASSLSEIVDKSEFEKFLSKFPNITTLIIDGRGSSRREVYEDWWRFGINRLENLKKVDFKNINNNTAVISIDKCHNLNEVIVKDNTCINNFSCLRCDKLKKLTYNNTIQADNGHFYIANCKGLENFFINNCELGIATSIRQNSALKKIIMENTNIKGSVFITNCRQLIEIAIKKSVLHNPMDLEIFLNVDFLCKNLEKISLNNVKNESEETKYISLENLSQCFSKLQLEVDGKDVELTEELYYVDPFEHKD